MKDYLSLREAAQKWGVSERRINQYCTEGRIAGAQRIGKAWAIPSNAQKPGDPRRMRQQGKIPPLQTPAGGRLNHANLMPLMNTAFVPGNCQAAALAMPPGPRRDIALAEYHYFSGQPEAAAKEAEVYLTSPDIGAKLSACLIYAYANLSLGRIPQARFALDELNADLAAAGKESPEFRAAAAFVASAGAVLLHLPMPDKLPEIESFLPLLPPGLRAFALYVQAHYLYLKKEYSKSAGTVEATLAMGASAYPIPAIYLHLVAVMDYMSLKQSEQAQGHLLTAWEMARPDDLIEGFGEHHGLLGAMLEAVIKPKWPEDFKRIIDITYRFSSGWRRVHNPITGHDVADDLTTTEFAIAMLAARNWTTQEIAEHLNISVNTVKSHISEAMRKLNVRNRKSLKQYMLE
ncbi:MAG TPA: LuxR C-terminal-related transcriptional regulator [Candidatus Blautia stercorigallinarum]|uniref:LuxR C-terminal-related transcriptional regulator n=1 Tax=Candidatus Blautia stercorigallinarum TaxID=2838501 RepID=A0A9D1TG80_9FIRM|nr:LuxR C-terminal-related transcriptional regulator [Candidatus Blautia stercorigallinarum]